MNRASMLRTDDIRRLLEVKDFNNKNRQQNGRAESVSSDDSDRSDLSTKSMPQYSSYRTLSGGLFGPFEKSAPRPGSRSSFLHLGRRGSKTPEMSHIPAPSSRMKPPSSAAKPRGTGEGSSRPSSRAGSAMDETPVRPGMVRETSASKLPVYRREASMPQIRRESSIPKIKREKSDIRSTTKTTPATPKSIATPRGKNQPIIQQTTPKTVAERKVSERNIQAKGTRSGVSGISENVMIGDRVNITATNKKGIVQFVGETRFAKGVWAGVVLDDKTGKNDGSVAGVRYFTCPPLRGVFVKEEKLEKISDVRDKGFTPHGTAADRKPSLASLAARNNSAMSTDSGVEDELSIGDYVRITSASGNREGILRFLGVTEFAKGTWCGVELEDPSGKNDGAVAGTRYFQCEPKHGLFAQVGKVKKIKTPPHIQAKLSTPTQDQVAAREEIVQSITPSGFVTPDNVSGAVISPEPRQDTTIDSETAIALQAVDAAFSSESFISPRPEDSVSPTPITPSTTSTLSEVDIHVEEQNKKILALQRQLHKQDEELHTLTREKQERASTGDKVLREHQENAIRLQGQVGNLEREKLNLQNDLNDTKQKMEDLQFQLEEQLLLSAEDEDKEKDTSQDIDVKNQGPSTEELDKVLGLQSQLDTKEKEIAALKSKLEKTNEKNEEEIFLLNEKDIQLEGKDKEIEKMQDLLKVTKDNESLLNTEISTLKQKLQDLRDLQASVSDAERKTDNVRSDFEEKLLQRDRKVLDLQDKLTEKDNEIVKLEKSLSENETKFTNQQYRIEKMREELDETLEFKGKLNKQIVELNTELTEKRNEIQQNSQITETLQHNNLDLKAKLEALESRNGQLTEDKKKLEEDVLKVSKNSGDNAQQMVYLNEQIQAKNRELATAQDQLSTTTAENNKLTQEITNLQEKFDKEKALLEKEKTEENEKLRESIVVMEDHYKKVKIKNDEIEETSRKEKIELQQSSSEVKKLSELNQNKDSKLSDIQSEVLQLQEKLQVLAKTTEQHQTEHEVTKKQLLHKINDIEELKNTIAKSKNENTESTEQAQKLLDEIQNLRIERTNLEKRLNCMEQEKETYANEKDSVSKTYNDVLSKVEHLKSEKEELLARNTALEKEKIHLEKQNSKLSDEITSTTSATLKYEEEVRSVKQQLSNDTSNLATLQSDVTELQNQLSTTKASLKNKQDENSLLQTEKVTLQTENQELTQQFKRLQDNNALKENDSTNEISKLRNELKESIEREQTSRTKLNEERQVLHDKIESSVSSFKTMDNEIQQLRNSMKILEEKNQELNDQLNTTTSSSDGTVSTVEYSRLSDEMKQIRAVKDEKEQEVNFLNSIIVDLQAKNHEQERKIKVLSFGDNPEDLLPTTTSLDNTMSPVTTGLRARLFCDICDVFDKHDTEDCPLQSNDGDNGGGTQHHGERGSERPYCTSCETFGHLAEDCDDEEEKGTSQDVDVKYQKKRTTKPHKKSHKGSWLKKHIMWKQSKAVETS